MSHRNHYLVISRGTWDESATKAENPCLAFGLTLEIRPLEEAKALATDTTNETPDAWRVRA
jgi:hypothetical protein